MSACLVVVAPTLRHSVPYCCRVEAHVCLNTDRRSETACDVNKVDKQPRCRNLGTKIRRIPLRFVAQSMKVTEKVIFVQCYASLYWTVIVPRRGTERTNTVLYAASGEVKQY